MSGLMGTNRQRWLFALGVLLCASLFGCSHAEEAALFLNVASPAESAMLSTNLVEFTGTVNPDAEVTIAGNPAYMDEEGSFRGYALLKEGENTVSIRAQRENAFIGKAYSLKFVPPLALYLDSPQLGKPPLENPLTVTGKVSDPAASVTVNDVLVNVQPDGTFSAQIGLHPNNNLITAIAVRGDETETAKMGVYIDDNGGYMPPPGNIFIVHPEFNNLIYLEAGSTYTQNITLVLDKRFKAPTNSTYRITPVVLENDRKRETTWPDGLTVEILPSEFTVYPNSNYASLMVVKTAPGIPSGEYQFEVESKCDGSWSTKMIMNIVVLPRGGALQKTVAVNETQSDHGMSFTLESIIFTSHGFSVNAFTTPPGYTLPQGTNHPSPTLMQLHAGLEYRLNGNPSVFAGQSGISFLSQGMRHTWEVDLPVPKDVEQIELTITGPGALEGIFTFEVVLR
jgi:hypothetical protein